MLDITACVICHTKVNILQDVKKCLAAMMIFAKKFNHIGLQHNLRKQEEFLKKIVKSTEMCIIIIRNAQIRQQTYLEDNTKHEILRLSMETFDWKSSCIFCSMSKKKQTRHPDRNNCHEVTTLHFKNQVLLACQKRDDPISKEVALRVRA